MKITTVRRIAQMFFLALFLWFCVAATPGVEWWQLRGWPVNGFLQLDPLVALGTLLSTHTVYAGLLASLAVILPTLFLGRFFCGWVCPLGTVQQATGYLARRKRALAERVRANRYHPLQRVKHLVLVALLAGAAAGSLTLILFDPVALMQRSVDLALLPIADRGPAALSITPRAYAGAGLIGLLFLAVVAACVWMPRFYCRFVCPLGALLGWLSRFSIWRVGKAQAACAQCMPCEAHCEGACEPSKAIRWSECVLCMNCLHPCGEAAMAYRTARSASGEITAPDIGRRGFLVSAAAGLAAAPMIRLNALLGLNWNPRLLRPPGAAAERDFLSRCVKCGRCMRACPTNIIQPAGLEAGVEGIWTPVLNFRIGTSGCQLNCVACGHVCPTAALRPLRLDEKLGRGAFREAGPVRMGTAFVDQGRCLPWSMDRPCIVCQESCPASPKAIFVRSHWATAREELHPVARADELTLEFGRRSLPAGRYGSGDYYCVVGDEWNARPRRIAGNGGDSLTIDPNDPWEPAPRPGAHARILVRLQRPYVDPARCTGCGVCEHECPVAGLRAIRVTAENESRHPHHSITVS